MLKQLSSVLLAISLTLTANAGVNGLPVRTIDGKEYYCYKVEAGEGTLAISKKLGLSINEIEKYNPEVASGLKLGQELRFPVGEFSKPRAIKPQKRVIKYVAKKGDTVYGISKAFNMELYDFLDLNPDAIEGVKIGETYKVTTTAPMTSESLPVETAQNEPLLDTRTDTRTHVIASGETLFSIAKKYDCNIKDLYRLNPGLDKNHYEIGQEINVPQSRNSVEHQVAASFTPGTRHIVKEHDTFYGVAREYGLSIEQLQNANPGVNILKEGMTLIIPDSCAETDEPDVKTPAVNVPATDIDTIEVDTIVAVCPSRQDARMTVALLLPFQSNLKEKSREGKSSAEFYRGFMLAANNMKNQGMPLTVIALDTDKSGTELSEILATPELKKANAIIAPENAATLGSIADFGRANGISVYNLFSTKDDSYLTNPYLFQGNIPIEDMVRKASDYLVRNAGDATVVILHPRTSVDKIDVAEKFKTSLKEERIPVLEITYNNKLTSEELSKLSPTGNYIFIPTTAKSNPSGEILASLAQYVEENPDAAGRFSVFGYPEWIVFKGKSLDNMKAVNTSIYTRFFIDPAEEGNKTIADEHMKWYGADIPAGVPRMTLSGYDTAMLLFRSWEANKGDYSRYSPDFDGEQTPYHFKKSTPDGGWVNDSMYIINYRPSGLIEKIPL